MNKSVSVNQTVVLLPGVEGGAWQLYGTVNGLRRADIAAEFDVISWGVQPFGSFDNLMNLEANKKRAKEFAAKIEDHYASHPDRPITLVGFSGGGGLGVLVAENLSTRVKLRRLILIGAAVSPHYDLTGAMTRCEQGIVNVYSPGDWFILGAGTSVFGTIDREKSASAGFVGFLNSEGQLRKQNGLTQIVWQLKWVLSGHDGSHIGWLSSQWACDYLAAIIQTGACVPVGDATSKPVE